jgi:hypothetical protein
MSPYRKHTFNATPAAQGILDLAETGLGGRTEFINRLVVDHGMATIHRMMAERAQAVQTAEPPAAVTPPAPTPEPPRPRTGRVPERRPAPGADVPPVK